MATTSKDKTSGGAEEVQGSKASAEFATQDAPPKVEEDTSDSATQSYVWLADGSVLRVRNEDLPPAGHLTLGHWQRGDKVYLVVAIYPVEDKGQVSE